MKLTIKSAGPDDFGAYQCIAKNTIAQTDGTIKVYRKYYKENIIQLLYS